MNSNRITHLSLLVVFILTGSITLAAKEDDAPDRETVVAMIRKVQSLKSVDFKTSFEVITYNTRQFPVVPGAGDPPIVMWDSFDYTAVGDRLHLDRKSYNIKPNGKGRNQFPNYHQVNIWNGDAWYQSHPEEDPHFAIYAKPSPADFNNKGFIFTPMEDRFPSYGDLENMLSTGKKVKFERVDSDGDGADDSVSVQFDLDDTGIFNLRILLSDEAIPRILSHTTVLHNPDDHAVYEYKYTVKKWKTIDNKTLPQVAYLDRIYPIPPDQAAVPGQREFVRTVYRRTDFQLLEEDQPDEELFSIDLKPGTGIYDERFKLSFEIGKSYLVLDGVIYNTPNPIMEHPGDKLNEIIKSSTKVGRE